LLWARLGFCSVLKHHHIEGLWVSGGMDPPFITAALPGGGNLHLPLRFTTWELSPGTRWIGDWSSPVLDAAKIEMEPLFIGRPACSTFLAPSLYHKVDGIYGVLTMLHIPLRITGFLRPSPGVSNNYTSFRKLGLLQKSDCTKRQPTNQRPVHST
jgi:hypothetical protein